MSRAPTQTGVLANRRRTRPILSRSRCRRCSDQRARSRSFRHRLSNAGMARASATISRSAIWSRLISWRSTICARRRKLICNCGYGRGFSVLEVVECRQESIRRRFQSVDFRPPSWRCGVARRLYEAHQGRARLDAEIRRLQPSLVRRSIGSGACTTNPSRGSPRVRIPWSATRSDQVFMDSKKVALPFGVSRNLPSRNSIPSIVPIGLRIRRSTYIFFKISGATRNSSLRVPERVMSSKTTLAKSSPSFKSPHSNTPRECEHTYGRINSKAGNSVFRSALMTTSSATCLEQAHLYARENHVYRHT